MDYDISYKAAFLYGEGRVRVRGSEDTEVRVRIL